MLVIFSGDGVIENYLRHGDYPIGITKDEKANLRRNKYKFDEGILYYKKKTDTSEEDSQFEQESCHAARKIICLSATYISSSRLQVYTYKPVGYLPLFLPTINFFSW